MNPSVYAQELVKCRGKGEASRIAADTMRTMELAMMDPDPKTWGTPLSNEVIISEQTEVENGKTVTRTVTIINHNKKMARMKNIRVFWTNVVGYLKKRYPEEFRQGAA